MDKLIRMLKDIESSKLPDSYNTSLNDVLSEEDDIREIEELASFLLINSNGQNIYSAHNILKEAGFNVFCGEKDRCGWLSGCIQTKKGVITYF